MTLYGAIFYVLALIILVSTAMAITGRHVVHSVVYLVISFFGTALLFYLLGAPFLAALVVIIYAGAIMVLFLFVVMTFRMEDRAERGFPLRRWGPALLVGCLFLVTIVIFIFKDPASRIPLETAMAKPLDFGRFVFERYWFAVEIISFLLFIALVAALQIGRKSSAGKEGG
jgi:NADH-quinone oxidoreductase subunit J